MDNNNVKTRDVMSFENFAKAYDKAKEVIPMKPSNTAHPQSRTIKAEGLYARHDANVYRAAGIPVEKDADSGDRVFAGHDVPQEKPHDGQDPLPDAKLVKGQDLQMPKELKAQEKQAGVAASSADDSSEIIKKKQ